MPHRSVFPALPQGSRLKTIHSSRHQNGGETFSNEAPSSSCSTFPHAWDSERRRSELAGLKRLPPEPPVPPHARQAEGKAASLLFSLFLPPLLHPVSTVALPSADSREQSYRKSRMLFNISSPPSLTVGGVTDGRKNPRERFQQKDQEPSFNKNLHECTKLKVE